MSHNDPNVLPIDFFDNQDVKPLIPEDVFREGASMAEGVSGRARIDTTFENTVRPVDVTEKSPRNDDFGEDIGQMEDHYV